MNLDNSTVEALRESLLGFYDRSARDLPWRSQPTPYRVWVSEIMLQQTRVETVVPYYRKWMDVFPTVEALADSPLESVLEAWAGLGYYSRARNLHRAARVVRERHAGVLPDSVDGLRGLPGIGEYTAGAIASIAFGVPEPAVDGNVRRVFSRLFDLEKATAGVLRRHASALVDPERPGDFNQALMEHGAVVCVPRNPACTSCSVRRHCLALLNGTVDQRPPPKPKKSIPTQELVVVVLRAIIAGERVTLLRRRPPDGLLGGMLEFPSLAHSSGRDAEAHALACRVTGRDAGEGTDLGPVAHRFSHLVVTYYPIVFDVAVDDGFTLEMVEWDGIVVPWHRLESAALSAAQRRIAKAAELVESPELS